MFLTYLYFLIFEGVQEIAEELLTVLLLVTTETWCPAGIRTSCLVGRFHFSGHVPYKGTQEATHLSQIWEKIGRGFRVRPVGVAMSFMKAWRVFVS